MSNVKLIPNQQLALDKIPNPEDKSSNYQEEWEKFALTMNGYNVTGDFQSCADLSRKVLEDPEKASLTELRCALFFNQRAYRHSGGMNVGEVNGKNLIKLIREKVKKGIID